MPFAARPLGGQISQKTSLIDTAVTLKDGTSLRLASAHAKSAGKVLAFRKALHSHAQHLNADEHEAAQGWFTTRRILSHAYGNDRALYLLAWQGAEIVGELQMRVSGYERLRHDMRIALGVAPGHDNRGIGRALLQAGTSWARGNPALKRLSLSVHADNTRALALYKSLGFVEEGRRKAAIMPIGRTPWPGQNDQEPIDEILMGLYLT